MIRDRGTKKWTSLMLPEHVEMLRKFAEEYYHVDKPLVDEFELEEFDERIAYAKEYRIPVKFTVWQAGVLIEETGRVKSVDPITKQVRLTEGARLNMADVVAVEIIDE
jgi:hypothetical protein